MKRILSAFLCTFIALLNLNAISYAEELKHGFTAEQALWMKSQNKITSLKDVVSKNQLQDDKIRPYAEYKDQGYLIFNDEFMFNSQIAKRGFLQHLPDDITPVVFTQNQSPEYIQSDKELFGSYMVRDRSRLKVMSLDIPLGEFVDEDGNVFEYVKNGFWARDHIPVPMFYHDQGKDHFMVVDAKYYHEYEADQQVADHFNAPVWSHNYYFEGGNFVVNAKGDCLIVNNPTVAEIPDNIFTAQYGCTRLVRLPDLRGIGHADESVKFVDDNLILTDMREYKGLLEDLGFDVVMLPRINRSNPFEENYETYVNSVILKDVVYVPVFNNKKDKKALAVYRNLGLRTVPLNSEILSSRGQGSLHCISMVYPKVEYSALVDLLGANEL